MNEIATATILVCYAYNDAQEQSGFDLLAESLAARLDHPVIACALDQPGRPLLHAITRLLQQGTVRVVVVPLLLSQAELQDDVIPSTIAFASSRWPYVHFHLSPLLRWDDWLRVVDALAIEASEQDNLRFTGLDWTETAVILVGRGSDDPHINSDLARLARLLYEEYTFGWTDVAFVGGISPSVGQAIERYQIIGAKKILVIPFLLFRGRVHSDLLSQLKEVSSNCQLTIASCLTPNATLIDNLHRCCQMALEDRSLLPVSWSKIQMQLSAELEAQHRQRPGELAADEEELQQVLNKVAEILPPRYQGSVNPDGAMPAVRREQFFDDEGLLEWAKMEGMGRLDCFYGELALAGGASHRKELLEAVNPDDCIVEAKRYAAVLRKIGSGIAMTTGLATVESKSLGWLGVQCDSAEMAIWLVRAIIVENVMVRREEDVLYLPAGPHFTDQDQILSIVTVVAKTWHFWIEHITAKQWNDFHPKK